jgi:glycerophosphoryl diester phosphodiesterase
MLPSAKPSAFRAASFPLIVAHRGASADAPENTWAAFELALAQGADGIEFDVHLTRDGVPVVLHDTRLERTTNGRGRVRETTAAALARLNAGSWFNRRFPERARAEYSAARIPRLDEVLRWVRARRCQAFLEIKQPRLRYRGIEAKALEQIYAAGAERQVTVISFHLATLARLRRLDPHIALGLDVVRPLVAVARARRVSAQTLLPHWRFATPQQISRAHRAGLQVFAWGLDDPRALRRSLPDGLDGIITSFPALLRRVWPAGPGARWTGSTSPITA